MTPISVTVLDRYVKKKIFLQQKCSVRAAILKDFLQWRDCCSCRHNKQNCGSPRLGVPKKVSFSKFLDCIKK